MPIRYLLIFGSAIAAALLCLPGKSVATLTPSVLPANGVASARLELQQLSLVGTPAPFLSFMPTLEVEKSAELVNLGTAESSWGHWHQDVAVGVKSGTVELSLLNAERVVLNQRLKLIDDTSDWDKDGFANAIELPGSSDRKAFRTWFTSIARSQAVQLSSDWYQVHQDCAGLLRYAYKESLKRHDRRWWQQTRALRPPLSRDIKRYQYPDVPVVGTAIFKTADPAKPFSAHATARGLRDHNSLFLGKNAASAQPGDLLFFERVVDGEASLHSMIYLGLGIQSQQPEVVYHTGPDSTEGHTPDGSGEVRLVTINTLNTQPDSSWHIKSDNPNFNGFYRWRILD